MIAEHTADTDFTTDPHRQSWLDSANNAGIDFPIQNLPFGVFRRAGTDEAPRVGIAIGDAILDIPACLAAGLLDDGDDVQRAAAASAGAACVAPALNALMQLGRAPLRALRRTLFTLLSADAPSHQRQTAEYALVKQRDAELFLPASVGDYTDFYASVHHATNVGALFRPDNPLLPNYKWVPIGYHGRASSLVVTGTPITRPHGQMKGAGEDAPVMGPSRALDYELELGAFIGIGNALGSTIPLGEAEAHLFGLCLLNDWSARDVQSWEYQPLGPFLAKSFSTTLSPWVVTLDALAPFRRALTTRSEGDPAPLAYLSDPRDLAAGGFDVTVEAWLSTSAMRTAGQSAVCLSTASALDLYWSFGQMITHHSSNGCNLRAGDLLGSGTISGAKKDSRGCLLELTRRGADPVTLPNGETRAFLLDGDEITLRASAQRAGAVRIGFGECRGTVLGAPPGDRAS